MMGKGNNIGTCALCKDKDVKLLDSHIIPKLVYRRLKSYKNSRFRNYYDINDIFQDGEKKPMLCSSCEKFFNKFETEFANEFLDKYSVNSIKNKKSADKFDDFIYSLNWRIIYDDLYVFKSFTEIDKNERQYFYDIELKLADYLNRKKNSNYDVDKPKDLKNYIFYIEDLGLDFKIIEAFKSSTFGYCFNADYKSKYVVMTYFLGIIFVTSYDVNSIILTEGIMENIKRKFITGKIDNIIKEELIWQYNKMISHKSINDAILNSGLKEKLENRYHNK